MCIKHKDTCIRIRDVHTLTCEFRYSGGDMESQVRQEGEREGMTRHIIASNMITTR